MNKRIILIGITCMLICFISQAQTWSEWFEQKKTQRKYLLEQIVKLQVYLGYAKKGYNIASNGLNLIGDIKNGDLNLHRFFFNSLKQVNPEIKRYAKVGDMISMQLKMISTYRTYYKQIRESELFSNGEIEYFYSVFTNLFSKVANDMESLTTLLTDGQLEMQDDERLQRINDLHSTVSGKYHSFFSFTNRITLAAKQKERELTDLKTLQKLY